MAIIHRYGPQTSILRDPSLTLDPAGFDELQLRVLHHGDVTSLASAFTLGDVYPGTTGMFCIGPQGATESRFGHTWATIGYKGFWDSARKPVKSWSVTTRETELPRSYTKADGSPWTTYAGPPFSPSKFNPSTGTYWRVRLVDQIAGATLQGAHIGSPDAPPPIPRLTGAPPVLETNINWDTFPDRTCNYPHSRWVLRDFQTTAQFNVGPIALYLWTARFEYVERFGP